MDNFDLKRFLIENHLTRNSILPELARLKWTKDALEQEASKYNSPSEFIKADINIYNIYRRAVNNGLIQDKFKSANDNPNKLQPRIGKWTPEKLEQEAAKYNTPKEFQMGNSSAYSVYRRAVNKGIISNKFEEQFKWTKDALEQEAAKYNTPKEFQMGNNNAYQVYRRAVNKGIISNKFETNVKWTPEKLEQEAEKYATSGEFFKTNPRAYSAYRKVVRNGLIQDKFKQGKTTPAGPSTTTLQSTNPTQSSNLYNNPYFGNTTTTFDKLKENKMQDFDLKKFLVENKMTRNSRLLNEITNGQIIQFVQNVDSEGRQYIETYFRNPGSYNIEGAIDYLASHSSLYDNNPDPDDQDGGLSGFTKSDLIQHAQDAGWDEESIDHMLELSPVKYLERG